MSKNTIQFVNLLHIKMHLTFNSCIKYSPDNLNEPSYQNTLTILNCRQLPNEMVSTGDTDLVSTYDLPNSEPTGGWWWGGTLESELKILKVARSA